jgi:hypothetical protein
MRVALERALHTLPPETIAEDQIRATAGRLVSRLASSVSDPGIAHAPTELEVVPSVAPTAIVPPVRLPTDKTLASIATARESPVPVKRAPERPVMMLAVVVVIAAVVTLGAVALVFCG